MSIYDAVGDAQSKLGVIDAADDRPSATTRRRCISGGAA
jgi:hypothetical protein